jgi:hypothetical protein
LGARHLSAALKVLKVMFDLQWNPEVTKTLHYHVLWEQKNA